MSAVYTRHRYYPPQGIPATKVTWEMRYPSGGLIQKLTDNRYLAFYESDIRDVVGRRRAYNPVDHWTLRYSPAKVGGFRWNTTGYLTTASPQVFPLRISLADITHLITPEIGFGIGTDKWQAFVNDSFYAVTKSIEEQFDFYQLLRDFATIRGLLDQIVSVGYKLFHALTRVCQLAKVSFARITVRKTLELIREGSNAYLLEKFGIEPLLREVGQLASGLSDINSRLEFLRSTIGKSFSANHSQPFEFMRSQILYGTVDSRLGNQPVYLVNVVEKGVYNACATVKNTASKPILDGLCGQLQAFIGGIGLGNGIAFLWDLVPFSFILNWFFNVSKWIRNNLTPDAFAGILKITDGGCSIKSTLTFGLECHSTGFTPATLDLGKCTVKHYQRVPGFAWDYSIFSQFSSLTPSQQAILAALVGQRV